MTPNKPFTPEEQAWIKANSERILQFIKQQAVSTIEKDDDEPISSAVTDLTKSISKIIGKISQKIHEEESSLKQYEKMAASPDERDSEYWEKMLKERKPEIEKALERYKVHTQALILKREHLRDDPKSVFLPIGTVVRFEGVPNYVNSLQFIDDRLRYPMVGSIGVVTGLSHTGEYSLAVSMRNPFKDGYGDLYEPEYDRMPTYRVDRSMLSIIGYGKLPDGNDYLGYGFQATHTRKTPKFPDENKNEMILECDGHFWRFHDFGGTQSIEALHAYESLEEMTWIAGPREEYATNACLTP